MVRLIRGATGSGKTTELRRIFHEWVAGGVRTDQILVLTSGASQSREWRERLDLEAHGAIEAHSFFAFVQRELTLYWGAVQLAVPDLQDRVRPEFLRTEIAQLVIRGLLEPVEGQFGLYLKASPQRIAGQIAGPMGALGPALGLTPADVVERLAAADHPEKAELYQLVGRILNEFHGDCLRAGLLDYGLSLDLFTRVLLTDREYLEHLNRRFRCLVVDDLDETVPAEQDFIQVLSATLGETAFSYNSDGGHATARGADSARALERLGLAATMVELDGSYTCSVGFFQFGAALAKQVEHGESSHPFQRIVAHQISVDLRGDLVSHVVTHLGRLLDSGTPAGQIAIISPVADKGLAVTLAESLRRRGIPLLILPSNQRLVDRPLVRTLVTLGWLTAARWRIPCESAGPVAHALQILLNMDPVQASTLGDQVWRTREFPEYDQVDQSAYRLLRGWVQRERQEPREIDQFVQMALTQVVAPLLRRWDPQGERYSPATLNACQQFLVNAHRFRLVRERFGESVFGNAYVPLLTESSLPEDSPNCRAFEGLVVATPRAYLSAKLTSQVQVWYDISSEAWLPSEVRELFNPHVLTRPQTDHHVWGDQLYQEARRTVGARLARALVRRCTGQLVLAECSLNPWGHEQDGEMAGALLELTPTGRATR